MAEYSDLRVRKSEQPELYERIEDVVAQGESSVDIDGSKFEIVSSQVTLEGDATFVLVEL